MTDVPTPVVTVDPSDIDLSQFTNDINYTNFTISNHGLIDAPGGHTHLRLEPIVEHYDCGHKSSGTLPAESSVTVPVTFQRLSPTSQIARLKSQAPARRGGHRKHDDDSGGEDLDCTASVLAGVSYDVHLRGHKAG